MGKLEEKVTAVQYLYKQVSLRKPFRLARHSTLSRLYLRLAKSAGSRVFTVLYTLLFYAWQKAVPFPSEGEFLYEGTVLSKPIRFNAKNTQFEAVYNPLFDRGYEPEIGALLDIVLERKGAFIDIGSNWGYFALHAASLAKFHGYVYACEPFPSTFADLTSVVSQAGLGDKITCWQVAFGQKKAWVKMSYRGLLQSGLAALDAQKDLEAKSFLYSSSKVEVTTLDDVITEPPSVIKIDVEGAESGVLWGGKATINKHKPMIIFENSTWPEDVARTLEPLITLTKWGYQLFYPCWQLDYRRDPFFSGELTEGSGGRTQKLALLPLNAGTRFVFSPRINVFACHESRINSIKRSFTSGNTKS